MGREQDPFQKRQPPQNGRRRGEYEDEPGLYEDGFDYDEYDEFELENIFNKKSLIIPRRRSVPPLPPFSSRNRNVYPRRSYSRRVPEATTPRPPTRPATRSKRPANLSGEPGRRPMGPPPS